MRKCKPFYTTTDFEAAAERFWSKVNKGGDCWLWIASKTTSGYGKFVIRGKYIAAHRYAYTAMNGPVPDGMCVCHKCDNRACVNPAHLWLGSNDDNMADMADKQRSPHGSQHMRSRLTPKAINDIRELHAAGGYTHRELARMFGVSRSTATKAINGTTWIHYSR